MATVNRSRVVPQGIISAGDDESMEKFMDRTYEENPVKLRALAWGHYKRGLRYKNFREVFSRPEGAQGLKATMADLSEALSKNREVSVQGAGGDVLEAITSYPFVVLEPDFIPPTGWADLFVEEGAINLPFPMITVLTAMNHNAGEGFDTVAPVFLSQGDDGNINVHVALGESPSTIFKRPHIATINLSVREHPETHILRITPSAPVSQAGWMDYSLYSSLAQSALVAIYMLTHHTGEVLMSRPSTEDVAANKKRARKGKAPLVEFKLVSITGKETHKPSIPHGTHASPKQHWRRGHWRTYKSGKRSWVEPMLVGDEKNGKIIKDYAIGNYRDSGSHAIIR
jgi:hypothetical protein